MAMRAVFIVAVFCFCFCGSTAFARGAFIKAPPGVNSMLDAGGDDSSPVEGITNFINKLDSWIQKNLW